jgi:hypothetical protein
MRRWLLTIGLAVLAWAVPLITAMAAFNLRASARPLFESVMAFAVAAGAAVIGLVYLSRVPDAGGRGGLFIGVCAVVACGLLDGLLMLPGGPLQMTFGEYLADIGATYLLIPVVTWATGVAAARARAVPAPHRAPR